MLRTWKSKLLMVGLLFFACAVAQAQTAAEKGVTVSGEVHKPGRYEIRERLTALDALRQAGGLTDPAGIDNLLILRRRAGKTPELLTVHLKTAPRRGGRIDDPLLQDGDQLLVGSQAVARVERFLKSE